MFKTVSMALVIACMLVGEAYSQTTQFNYQGSLNDGAVPANGNYDFEFRLFDGASAQVGPLVTRSNVPVAAGTFAVSLDFGNVFSGSNRFLDIRVRTAGVGTFTPLTPRQQLNSTPHAVRSLIATSADSVPVAGVPAGSGNYIQNTAVQQASSNFSISGSGTAAGTMTGATVNAVTQFNLNGGRLIHLGSNPINENLFVGPGAGSTTTFCCNAFFGFNAGGLATAGAVANSLFGHKAGEALTTGDRNSLFGHFGGKSITTATGNAFFGDEAGRDLASGGFNALFGSAAGVITTSGNFLSLFGDRAIAANNLTNATAIGANALVSQSNSLVLGDTNVNVGIGTSAPLRKLHVLGSSSVEVMIESSDAGGRKWTLQSSSGGNGGRFEIVDRTAVASRMTILDDGSIGIGTTAPTDKLHVAGTLRVNTLGASGATQLCRNASNQISTCTAAREGLNESLNTSVEALRSEISALRNVNAVQQRQLDEQSRQIELLVKLVCPAASGRDGCTSR
ncbi:MAG: hypothetical protein ABIV21_09615 [Pyrinomonadaceae bacterium]